MTPRKDCIDPAAWRIQTNPEDEARYRKSGWWRDRTPLDDFLACVEAHPSKASIVAYTAGSERPQTLTYGQLGAYVDRCAGALIELGVRRGDVVSLQLPNSWEFPILALATMRAGALVNPIPAIYRERELSFMLRHAASRILAVPTEFRSFSHEQLARKLQQEIPTLDHIVSTGAPTPDVLGFQSRFIGRCRESGADLAAELEQRRPRVGDPALLMFTSGTTGTPKAALHTYNTLYAAGQPLADALSLSRDDVCFMASTVGHLTGFYWGTVLPLSLGQTVVYQDIWDAERLIDIIEVERISWTLSATPFALDLVEARKKSKAKLESFRAFVCGGAPIPPQTAISVQDVLGVKLISLWGCTEVGICTIHSMNASVEVLANSDGMPVPSMRLRIVNEELEPVEANQEGRLQVRGPGVFAGYFNQPELTAAAQTADGWFETGDQGRATADGGIRITGRTKDIIVRGGQNVPVVEIENELRKMPNIRDIAIVGVPDERLGERGCAVVVAQGPPPSLADLKRQLEAARITKQFWPELLEIIDEMPRTAAGKIQKYILRERLSRSSAGGRRTWD